MEKLLTADTICQPQDFTATTAAGTLTLTAASNTVQHLTGSAAGFNIVLPVATTLSIGWRYQLSNTTSQTIQVKDGSGANEFVLSQSSIAYLELTNNTTASGTWLFWQVLATSTASGIINYNLVSSTVFTTSSQTDVVITAFSVTPQAGTYGCWYNASSFYTTTPKSHWWSFYKDGVQIVDSERLQDTAHSSQTMVDTTITVASFNGSQTMDVRVRCANTGALTINARTMILIRLGS